jgi:head-tail adaptor
MINARRMRHSVDVAVPQEVLGDRGQKLPAVPLVVSKGEPCEIETLQGREIEQSRQMFASATHRVRMRFNRSLQLSPKHLLLFNGRTLNIGHVNNVNQNDREIVLLCAEEVQK